MRLSQSVFGVVLALSMVAAEAAEPIIIPVVHDPNPVIDGSLRDWENRGALRELNQPEQVTFNREGWKGPADLSGWVRFGYDDQNLYVACHVVDDLVMQEQTGRNAWKGDHVMLTLDFVRSGKMSDLIQMGLSPGALATGGEAAGPELIIWRPPTGYPTEGAQVVARRTEQGYDMEAAIPWRVLKVDPVTYQTLALQLGFSDCDTKPNTQQKVMSIGTAKWEPLAPKRLRPVGLADSAGKFPPGGFDEATVLARELQLKHQEKREFVIEVAEPASRHGSHH